MSRTRICIECGGAGFHFGGCPEDVAGAVDETRALNAEPDDEPRYDPPNPDSPLEKWCRDYKGDVL